MENFFSFLALAVVLASFPCGYWAARSFTKSPGGRRLFLTLIFGAAFLIAGVIAVIAGCSAMGGKLDVK